MRLLIDVDLQKSGFRDTPGSLIQGEHILKKKMSLATPFLIKIP